MLDFASPSTRALVLSQIIRQLEQPRQAAQADIFAMQRELADCAQHENMRRAKTKEAHSRRKASNRQRTQAAPVLHERFQRECAAVYMMKRPMISLSSNLDRERFEEARFYLGTYDRVEALLLFYLKHGLLVQALQHIQEKDVGVDVFVQHVVSFCLVQGKLEELLDECALIQRRVKSAVWEPFLVATWKHLLQDNCFQSAYTVLVHLNDHVEAGLVCTKVATVPNIAINIRQAWWRQAERHFEQSRARAHALTNEQAAQRQLYLDMVRWQLTAIRIFSAFDEQIDKPKLENSSSLEELVALDLFSGNKSKQIELCYELLVRTIEEKEYASILFEVLKMIEAFRLDSRSIFLTAARNLASINKVSTHSKSTHQHSVFLLS